MDLPPPLLQAVAVAGGGRITLVAGAGCSFEQPTGIPLSVTCSQQCYDRLVANGVLAPGDCPEPADLSALADAVVAHTGGQRALVEQLSQHYHLRTATPNDGHLLAAALLSEGAILSVLTLNFDLALTTAISALGVGDAIGIINGPDDLPNRQAINLYYLHGNAATTPESWILRSEALATRWHGEWESVIATTVVAAPVVIFVGLGSPAEVLLDSAQRIRRVMPAGNHVYQVDPAPFSSSGPFARALDLDTSHYVQGKWCDFMHALSARLVVEYRQRIEGAAAALTRRERFSPEDLSVLVEQLSLLGLVRLGKLRASWLLHDKPYLCENSHTTEFIVDLLLALALIARETKTIPLLCEDGVVEFWRSSNSIASVICVSGRGSLSRSALEVELAARARTFRVRATRVVAAILANTRDGPGATIGTPSDIIRGELSDSIVFGPSTLPVFHVDLLRMDPAQCRRLAA